MKQRTLGRIITIQGDIREIDLPNGAFDIILAAAVLHHLRADSEWRNVFAAFHRALRPGGSLWVFDLVESSIPAVQKLMRQRYGDYLTRLSGRSLPGIMCSLTSSKTPPPADVPNPELLRQVGFGQVEVLHKNLCFAAYGAVKT